MSSDAEIGTLTDQYGDQIVVSVLNGGVCLQFWRGPHDFIGMWLGLEQQEEFAQLYVAACHQARANAEAARAEAREEARAHAEAVREERLDAAEIAADRRAYFDID